MAIMTERFKEALLSSDEETAKRIMNEAKQEYTPLQFVEKVLVKTLDLIGDGWEKGEYALSQVYMSGKICESLFDSLLVDQKASLKNKPKLAIALLNDYHALGKRIVVSNLKSGGYEIIDYDRVDVEELVTRTCEDRIELLLVSVLMLSSALKAKEAIWQIHQKCPEVKVIVGGAPFRLNSELWREVGADAVGITAADALSFVQSFHRGQQS